MNVSSYIALPHSDLGFAEMYGEIATLNHENLPELKRSCGSERYAKAILLKISNYSLLRFQYLRKHSRLIAKPPNIVIDPSNACQLKCPGCLHREDGDLSAWDKSLLQDRHVETLLRHFGSFAVYAGLFNWGEPLTNRNTPKYIREMNRYLIDTRVSSNLSLSFDAEELVNSGLQSMILSVDGATQEILERYRRGVNAELVFENMRRLVEAKKKSSSRTPYIMWQFIMFEHNIHQMPQVESLAKEIGVDQINFIRPYDFSYKGVKPASSVENRYIQLSSKESFWQGRLRAFKNNLSERIDEEYESFMAASMKIRMFPGGFGGESKNACRWLYEQITIDANGRVMPCTAAPANNSWFFSCVEDVDPFNSRGHISARSMTMDQSKPCDQCAQAQPTPISDTAVDLAGFLFAVDFAEWSRFRC